MVFSRMECDVDGTEDELLVKSVFRGWEEGSLAPSRQAIYGMMEVSLRLEGNMELE